MGDGHNPLPVGPKPGSEIPQVGARTQRGGGEMRLARRVAIGVGSLLALLLAGGANFKIG